MKINRFKGTDMGDTLRMVREALGSDAVILETNRHADGVEIAAAIDFDPVDFNSVREANTPVAQDIKSAEPVEAAPEAVALAEAAAPTAEVKQLKTEVENIRYLLEEQLARLVWQDGARRSPEAAGIVRNLARLGIEQDVAAGILGKMVGDESSEVGWTASLKYLADALPTTEEDLVCRGGIFALVGPTGVGKTTTIAKLAARYSLTHGRDDIAFVTTDNYRIAAREQLEIFARILGAPVYEAADSDSLSKVLHGLKDKGLVLIDTAGMGQKDVRLAHQFGCLSHADADIEVLLTLPANVQSESMKEIVNIFRKANPVACVLTKVDEAASLGGALSTIIRSGLPLAYVTDGQRVPEDLDYAPPRCAWLMKSAVEAMTRGEKPVTEDYLAKNYGEVLKHGYA